MNKKFEKFTISQVAVLVRNNKCLVLEFSDRRGYWGLPGGRIDEKENGEAAFRREIKEELNLSDFEIIDLIDFDVWYSSSGKPYSGVAYLIKNDNDQISLSHEHSKMEWVAADDLDNYNFIWPNAKRMLRKGLIKSSHA
ncbi:MAG: NUDIX hydrolase [Patescibacteria group bacterium]|nr:NUDIX hydrolase [Patescibacteria group bacterium]